MNWSRKKRCTLGKSCGATCISRIDECLIDLNGYTSENLSSFLKRVKSLTSRAKNSISKVKTAISAKVSTPKSSASGGDSDADPDVIGFDKKFKVKSTFPGSKTSFNWEHSHTNGYRVGEGAYGFATIVEGVNGKAGYVVKRGKVSTTEAEIIKKVGEAGIGPKLIYGEVGTGRAKTEYAKSIVNGRIAMSIVPGKEAFYQDKSTDKVGNTTIGDSFWSLRAQLHRLGIAHNDAHAGNVLVDDKGRARFVDLGLAQNNPKAALSEALGAFLSNKLMPPGAGRIDPMGGDFQVRRQPQYGIKDLLSGKPVANNLRTVSGNLDNVYDKLIENGFSNSDIVSLMKTGIRKPESHFEKGVWNRMNNDLALDLINTLYEGV